MSNNDSKKPGASNAPPSSDRAAAKKTKPCSGGSSDPLASFEERLYRKSENSSGVASSSTSSAPRDTLSRPSRNVSIASPRTAPAWIHRVKRARDPLASFEELLYRKSTGIPGPAPQAIHDKEAPPRPQSDFDDSLERKRAKAAVAAAPGLEAIADGTSSAVGEYAAATRFDDSLEKAQAAGADGGGARISHSDGSDLGPAGPEQTMTAAIEPEPVQELDVEAAVTTNAEMTADVDRNDSKKTVMVEAYAVNDEHEEVWDAAVVSDEDLKPWYRRRQFLGSMCCVVTVTAIAVGIVPHVLRARNPTTASIEYVYNEMPSMSPSVSIRPTVTMVPSTSLVPSLVPTVSAVPTGAEQQSV